MNCFKCNSKKDIILHRSRFVCKDCFRKSIKSHNECRKCGMVIQGQTRKAYPYRLGFCVACNKLCPIQQVKGGLL